MTYSASLAAAQAALISSRSTFLKPEELYNLVSAITDAIINQLAVSEANIAAILSGAPTAFDTFAEFYAQLTTDEASLASLITSVSSKLAKSSNLSDLASVSAARSNLGLGSLATASSVTASQISDASANGRDLIQAANYAAMKALLAIASGDVSGLGSLATASSVTASQVSDASANGRSLITAANYAAMAALLGLTIGTNTQAYSALLTSIAGLSVVSGDVIYGSGTGTVSRLAKGSDGQVLQLASGVPSWVTPGSGVSLASSTQAKAGVDNTVAMTPFLVELVRGPDTRALAMLVTELKGDRINMPDGIFDPFGDGSDVGTATNATLGSGKYAPTTTAGSQLSGGTTIGNATSAAQAFDGTTAQAFGSCTSLPNAGQIGKTLASSSKIGKAVVYTSTDIGLHDNNITNGTATIQLRGKQGAAPSNYATDGTLLGSYGPHTDSNTQFTLTINSSDTSTVWDHVWIYLSGTGASGIFYLAEVQFYAADTTNNMTLISAAFTAATTPTRARLSVQAKPIDSITINTDLVGSVSRDGGTTWTAATLAAETTLADGTTIYVHDGLDISAQPSGTSMKWKVVTVNNKNVELHGIGERWAA